MVKFIYGNPKSTDAEEAMNRVNRYVSFLENGGTSDQSSEDLYEHLYEADEYVSYLNATCAVDPTLSLTTSTKLKGVFRKIVRTFIQWAFQDVFSRQNEFNARVVQYVNSETVLLKSISEECMTLKEENEKLRLQLREERPGSRIS